MRKYSLIWLFFLALSTSLIAGEKYGLIIAVGDYPEAGGWPDISSQNDISHINGALRMLGFAPENIQLIQDQEATKEGIINAIKELTAKLKKGDMVYIHFSGHGQQVMDDDGDELDKLDEAIVPYDSALSFKKGFNEGQYLIRDDMLGTLTDDIRERCGTDGQLLLILDSCHSGTGTRGMGKARGTDKVMAPDDFKRSFDKETEKTMGLVKSKKANLAPMASYFGASAKELNNECYDDQDKPVGSLSYAITSVLANMQSTFSFEELFERVKLKMKTLAPRQNPQWEGPKDVAVLGGRLGVSDGFYPVIKVRDNTSLDVEVGTIAGVFDGSQVEVVSMDNNKVVGRGEVSKAHLTKAEITLTEPLTSRKDELIKVKVTEKTYPKLRCLVSSAIASDSKWSNVMDKVLSKPVVKMAETNADLFITECNDDRSLQIATADGSILFEQSYSKSKEIRLINEVNSVVSSFMQGKFLRGYDSPASGFDMDLEVVKVDCDNPSKELSPAMGGENISLGIGTCVVFKITNKGKRNAYFSLIDIQPNNGLNVLIPLQDMGYTAEEYFLEPGDSYTTGYCVEIGEPLGEETLKLISSKAPLNLAGIIGSGGNSTRGVKQHPFESMLAATFPQNATRGLKIKKAKVDEVGTETMYFKIVK